MGYILSLKKKWPIGKKKKKYIYIYIYGNKMNINDRQQISNKNKPHYYNNFDLKKMMVFFLGVKNATEYLYIMIFNVVMIYR